MSLFLAAIALAVAPSTIDEAPRDARVCRRSKITGTRLGPQRVCRTQAEWDRIEREARTTAGAAADGAGIGPAEAMTPEPIGPS